MSNVVTLSAARSVETAAAAMRTYVSPTADVEAGLALWRTEMAPGTAGPLHIVDTEHVVVVIEGELHAEVGEAESLVATGGCVVLPADTPRRLTAGPEGVITLTAAMPGSTARVGASEPVTVPWAN